MTRMLAAPERDRAPDRHIPALLKRNRPSSDAPAEPATSSSPRTLPPELLAEAARRLGWVALVYAGGELIGHFGRRLLLAASGSLDLSFRASDLLGLAAMAMGVAVYGLWRS